MFKDHNGNLNIRTIVLLVADIVLAVIILISLLGQKPEETVTDSSDLDIEKILDITPELPGSEYSDIDENNIESELIKESPSSEEQETSVPTAEPTQEPTPEPTPVATYEPIKPDRADRPTMADFSWYPDQVQLVENGSDVPGITDFSEVLGDWKAYIKLDPKNENNLRADLLCNVNIDVGQNDIVVGFDWFTIQYINDPAPSLDDTKNIYYNGRFIDGENGVELYAEGSGNVYLKRFYHYNGKTYGVGRMETAKGVVAILLLVRS